MSFSATFWMSCLICSFDRVAETAEDRDLPASGRGGVAPVVGAVSGVFAGSPCPNACVPATTRTKKNTPPRHIRMTSPTFERNPKFPKEFQGRTLQSQVFSRQFLVTADS